MEFIDRQEELRRLRRLSSGKVGFAVVYGRRRIGKSRLLTRWCEETDGIYLVGDTSSASIQRVSFALWMKFESSNHLQNNETPLY